MTRGLLRAGALLTLDDAGRSDEPTDSVSARTYSHAALGQRAVVRLVPDTLAAAEDLALEFLGFQLANANGPVAKGRRQALGFPGWALANDPANERHALAVVKDMERLARVARSKPGNAKDGFEQLADRLKGPVPHFLPTFYEQAGRAFIEAGNPQQAAAIFNRAREAEQVYGLELDEVRRRDVFLEFALAGALTARALDDYADRLPATHPPAEAYAIFRDLSVQRTLGGLSPGSGMAERLQRLARAARLDQRGEAEALLELLLDAPATRQASAGFWKAYRSQLLSLARGSERARNTLVDLFPSPQTGDAGFEDWWLNLLDDAGALEDMSTPAKWLERAAGWLQRSWRRRASSTKLISLLPRLAPRLKAKQVQLDLIGRWTWRADLELIDAAIEHGIPLQVPSSNNRLVLEAPTGSRELTYLVADREWRPLLDRALEAFLQQRGQADALTRVAGLRHLVVAWLDRCADLLERGGPPQIAGVIGRLAASTSERTLALNPSAAARMASVDLAVVLGRTLRGGVFEELGWPALDDVVAQLSARQREVDLAHAWPNVIVSDGSRVVVVGPTGVLLEHDLRPPPQVSKVAHLWPRVQPLFMYAGGQLLVMWPQANLAYWSGRPADVFSLTAPRGEARATFTESSVELPDGSRTYGGRAIRPGDTSLPQSATVLSDGTRFWRLLFAGGSSQQPSHHLHEFDPATGRDRGEALPAFLNGFADGLETCACSVLPAVPGLGSSPLGSADGLLGWRVRRRSFDGQLVFECEGVDGRRFTGDLNSAAPIGLVTLPGDEENPRPLRLNDQWLSLWTPDGQFELFEVTVDGGNHRWFLSPSSAVPLPPPFWHCLRPRDVEGSRALRKLSDATAARLLECVVAEISTLAPHAQELLETASLIRELIPEVSDETLLTGIENMVQIVGRAARQRDSLPGLRRATIVEASPESLTDGDLRQALEGLVVPTYGWVNPSRETTLEQIRVLSRAMAGGPGPAQIAHAQLMWPALIGRMGAVAFRACSPATQPAERRTLLALLELWAQTKLASGTPLRVAWANESAPLQNAFEATGRLLRTGAHVWLIDALRHISTSHRENMLVEAAPDGAFSSPAGMDVSDERQIPNARWEEPRRLRKFLELLRKCGPLARRPQHAEALAERTGLTRAEATLVLAGLPGLDTNSSNFLEKRTREMLGLNVPEASAARDSLKALSEDTRLDLLAAAMPSDPDQLWDADALVDRLAAAWIERVGRRTSVPEELIVQLRSAVDLPLQAQTLLVICADAARDPRLNDDGTWEIRASPFPSLVRRDAESRAVFDGNVLCAVALVMPWLFATLPVGAPMRDALSLVLERARVRVTNPNLLLGGDWLTLEVQGRAVLDLVGGKPYQPSGGEPVESSRDAGALIVVQAFASPIAVAFIRPAEIRTDDDPALFAMGPTLNAVFQATRFLRSNGATAMAERVAHTPVPVGGYEANPRLSVPELVDEVAAELHLDADAATVYLQVLSLAEPTTRNLATWNDWTAKRVKAALDVLVERGLLVRASRQRAGRDAFLPGAWDDLRPPNLPIERWKLNLYEDAPLGGRVLPLRPLHELFAAAWSRVRSGDAPGYGA